MFVSNIVSDEITMAPNPEMPKLLSANDMIKFKRISDKIQNSVNPNFSLEIRSNQICIKEHALDEEICLSKIVAIEFLLQKFKEDSTKIIKHIQNAAEKIKNQDLPDAKFSVHTQGSNSLNATLQAGANSVKYSLEQKKDKEKFVLSTYWKDNFAFTAQGQFDKNRDRWDSFSTEFENLSN